MLVIASNAPEQLDRAVYDRCDEITEFGLPGLSERIQIMFLYLETLLKNQSQEKLKELIIAEDINEAFITELGHKTEGFSGRELFKFVNSLNDYAMSKEDCTLDRSTVWQAYNS